MNNFYVSPEQIIKDKAEFAKKGIEKGRTTICCETKEGILFVADNPSQYLYKTSEIYDRIGFAGAGKYSEFENLRVTGIRHADMKGYSYSREDVIGRDIANLYSQALGYIFNNEIKPYEVEIVIAEISDISDQHIFHVSFDGTLTDKGIVCAIGGKSDELNEKINKIYKKKLDRANAVTLIKDFLSNESSKRILNFEVSVLEHKGDNRYFQRIS